MIQHRLLKVCSISLLFLALLAVVFLSASHRTMTSNASSPSRDGRWRVINSLNPGLQNGFTSVAALSANDVWAVGSKGKQGPAQTLIEHWNGSAWRVVNSPNPSSTVNSLNGVAAISSSNVWAVGTSSDGHASTYQTLIEHWNGSRWSGVSSPDQGQWSVLTSVTAISDKDAWAVGYAVSGNPRVQKTLIEHWNGSTWEIVNSPHQADTTTVLSAITAIGDDGLWAVGYSVSSKTLTSQTLIEHWNGSTWKIVASPNVKEMENGLSGVTAVSSHDIWAVGVAFTLSRNTFQTLIEHWNGSTWTIVASPMVSSQSFLHGVTTVSAREVWAVGLSLNHAGVRKTLIEHWNGSTWKIVASPSRGSATNSLDSVSSVPATGQIWAVGSVTNTTYGANTLAERYG